MNTKMIGTQALLLASSMLLSSCSLMQTEYQRDVVVPSSYGQAAAAAPNDPEGLSAQDLSYEFYRSFGDERLNRLIEDVLARNYEITSAYLNLKNAEVAMQLADSYYHPTASTSLGVSASKDLSHSSATAKGANSSLSLSYEVDLFGRLDAQSRSAYERFKASAYDYKAMRLAIIERTAEYYWNCAYAHANLQMAKEQLSTSQRRLDLITEKRKQGVADGLEYDTALVNHRLNEQSVYNAEHELTASLNALNALAGRFTESSLDKDVDESALYEAKAQKITTSIPADLLNQRPDLMSYEAKLRAAYSDSDLATSNFYPQFSISSSISMGNGGSLTKFFTDPVGALGAMITLPFINFNELSIRKEGALIAKDQAKLDFANGFITAVREVSDRINDLSNQEQLMKSYQQEYELTERNYQRYEDRYRLGDASLSDVLDASDNLRNARSKYLVAHRDLLIASIKLMTAVGGDTFADEQRSQQTPSQMLKEAESVHSKNSH